jgi:hypothetical protein
VWIIWWLLVEVVVVAIPETLIKAVAAAQVDSELELH